MPFRSSWWMRALLIWVKPFRFAAETTMPSHWWCWRVGDSRRRWYLLQPGYSTVISPRILPPSPLRVVIPPRSPLCCVQRIWRAALNVPSKDARRDPVGGGDGNSFLLLHCFLYFIQWKTVVVRKCNKKRKSTHTENTGNGHGNKPLWRA